MKVIVSKELQRLYIESNKNVDMALMMLLDSLDQSVFQKAFDLICPICLKGDPAAMKIGDSAIEQIKETFNCAEVSNDLANLLLWIAILFPEI